MKIAVIGTGNVGKALGGAFVRAGHDVTLAARNPEATRAVAAELGASAASEPLEAAESADVVVLAVPFATAGEEVARAIDPAVSGKVVIDPTNPARADFSGLVTEGGASAAERFAAWLPGARVVKAFNTLFASLQVDAHALDAELDALYATDDDPARATAAELIGSVGFRPVHAGALARAREMEALAWLNIQLQLLHQGDWRSSFTLVNAPAGAVSLPASAAA